MIFGVTESSRKLSKAFMEFHMTRAETLTHKRVAASRS